MQPKLPPRPPTNRYRRASQGVQPHYGPGSMTRPLDVNDAAFGASSLTGQRADVLRRNMGHFGVR